VRRGNDSVARVPRVCYIPAFSAHLTYWLSSIDMRITVQLKKDAASHGRSSRSRGAKRSVLAWLDRPLTRVHENTHDPALASFYEITVDDPAEAKRLLHRLQEDPAVDGAYIKPDDEPPM
jgi:hypothetical protein